MIKFIKNHFKFVFTIAWLTFIIIMIDNTNFIYSRGEYHDLANRLQGISEYDYACIMERFDRLEKKVNEEFEETQKCTWAVWADLAQSIQDLSK